MVYYVAFYTRTKDRTRRQNLAGSEKAGYIIKTFHDLGEEVTILSNARTISRRGMKPERIRSGTKRIRLYTFASWGKGGRVKDAINAGYGLLQLLGYMLLFVRREDTVCVYHSMGYLGLMALIRKVKKFRYILEVEELYQYIDANRSGYKKKEERVFSEPDAFIFSNRLIAEEVNLPARPAVVVNGVYRNRRRLTLKKESRVVRLVYAGSLEPQKGIGKILDIAACLDEGYELRIIGTGTTEDIREVTDRVRCLNQSGKKVFYDGIRTGRKYREYLQKCDIGLCIQDQTDIFNRYGFPSKVVSYLSNGLDVITNGLIQIKTSELAGYVNIVESDEAETIAVYINEKRYQKRNAEAVVRSLDLAFHAELEKLINQLMIKL